MKKLLSVLLVVMMMFAMVACGGGDEENAGGGDEATGTSKVGLGITVSLSATEATEDADGNAQQDGTAAAVLLDSEGKIVKCKIDVAQNKMAFSSEGVVLEKDKSFTTKKNLKEDYGMAPVSTLEEGEWYQQIAAFEEYVVGMTRDEVAAIETTESNGHQVATDETLLAGCTMQITDFMDALVKACDNAVDAGAATDVTLGIVSDMASSKDATEDEDGVAFSTSTYAATATDADGKITACLVDCTQSKITIGSDGSVVEVPETVTTKKELKDDYGMGPVSPLEEGEWYQQIAAFEAYVVGMTPDEVASIATTTNDEGHQVATDEALLAGCTMAIDDFMAAIVAGI